MSIVGFAERFVTIKVPIGTVTAPYGSIDSVHHTPHTGIDLACPEHTPIYAPLDGIVSYVRDYGDKGLGRAVFVKLSDGKQYIMGHFSEIKVHVGEKISKGDLLGLSGNTGHSTGAHLHFSAIDAQGHFIDPETLFESVHSSFTLWTNKVVALNNEAHTAFVSDPAIVSFTEPTSVLFKLLEVVTEVI